MAKLPDYREIEIPLSLKSIKNYLEPLLYTLGYVQDDEEILKLIFKTGIVTGDVVNEDSLVIPVLVRLKRKQEVEVINHI